MMDDLLLLLDPVSPLSTSDEFEEDCTNDSAAFDFLMPQDLQEDILNFEMSLEVPELPPVKLEFEDDFYSTPCAPPTVTAKRPLAVASPQPSKMLRRELEDECKNEIRKERNRQAAEKTRMRRLENARNLQTTVQLMERFVLRLRSEPCSRADAKQLEAALQSVEPVQVQSAAAAAAVVSRKVRVKKGNEAAELYKLKTNLSPEERAALQTEARKARNRASAERSRNKMLEANLDMQKRIALLKLQACALLRVRGEELWVSRDFSALRAFACSEQEVFQSHDCDTRPARSAALLQQQGGFYYIPPNLYLILVIRSLCCNEILLGTKSNMRVILYLKNLKITQFVTITAPDHQSVFCRARAHRPNRPIPFAFACG